MEMTLGDAKLVISPLNQ